jgi:hypothetical protein
MFVERQLRHAGSYRTLLSVRISFGFDLPSYPSYDASPPMQSYEPPPRKGADHHVGGIACAVPTGVGGQPIVGSNNGVGCPTYGYDSAASGVFDEQAALAPASARQRTSLHSCRPPAPHPASYITDRQEAELAEQVWKLAARLGSDNAFREAALQEFSHNANLMIDYHPTRWADDRPSRTAPVGQLHMATTVMHQLWGPRLSRARRQELMQKFLGKHYPDTALSNVSHFFEAIGTFPLLSDIPLIGIDITRMTSFALSLFWELGISPAMKVVTGASPQAAWAYDSHQFTNYDAAGGTFGADWLRWQANDNCGSITSSR